QHPGQKRLTLALLRNSSGEPNQPFVGSHPEVTRPIAVQGADCIHQRLAARQTVFEGSSVVPAEAIEPRAHPYLAFSILGQSANRVACHCARKALLLELSFSQPEQSAAPRAQPDVAALICQDICGKAVRQSFRLPERNQRRFPPAIEASAQSA